MVNIEIPDEWLRYALKEAIGKQLTKKKLETITRLDWNEYRDEAGETWSPISTIQGLEYCVNLEILSFDGNWVSDLSPLSGLKKLKEIWLVGNTVKDLQPISKLPNLEKLVLDMNSSLSDIKPLSNLPSIKYVNISSTKVKDLTPLQNLSTLEELSIYIDDLDVAPGSRNRNILIELIKRGVQVNIHGIEDLVKEATKKFEIDESASLEDKLRAQGAFKIAKIIETQGISGAEEELDNSPLHMALEHYFLRQEKLKDQKAVLNLLIENKADVNCKNKNGLTPLSYYLKNNSTPELEIVRLLLENGADINLSCKNRWGGIVPPPIYYAINEEKPEIINFLIENEAKTNIPIVFNYLCEHGYADLVESELKKGYEVNKINEYEGSTAIFFAARANKVDIIQFLLKYGANVNHKDMFGATPLHVAIKKEAIKLLLDNRADINAIDEDGRNALFSPVSFNDLNAVEILLKNGINVNIKDNYGNTPLHKVHYDQQQAQNSSNILKLLLKYGADVTARNKENKTPLDIITHPILVKIIKSFKKKPMRKQKSKKNKN